MRIGVISDTHLRVPDDLLEHILVDLFAGADMILHAGDIVTRRVLDRLEEAGVVAVCGNMDDYEVLGSIPQVRTLSVAGKRLGLIHGWGSKEGLPQRILARFGPDRPDIIVYGHSHVPFYGEVEGTFMFNPGAASQNRYLASATVGILEISEEKIDGDILTLQE
ncbi:MAG: metallophosphoesterase [Deltaproteobacteria bacterium]|nr:metallophosphoesterase [Deltaproteobacteria bacterium]